MAELADRLRHLRERKHPTASQQAVSELIGLYHDAIRRYEAGEAVPSLEALVKIADHYQVSTDYLLGRTKE